MYRGTGRQDLEAEARGRSTGQTSTHHGRQTSTYPVPLVLNPGGCSKVSSTLLSRRENEEESMRYVRNSEPMV